MGRLRSLFRWGSTAIVLLLMAPVGCRAYVALAEGAGRYDQPWHKAASVVWLVAQTVELWWFLPLLSFAAGVAVTLWVVDGLPRLSWRARHDHSELPVEGQAEARLRIVDALSELLDSKLRAAGRRGAELMGELPARIADGTADRELAAYADQVLPDLRELQSLTRLYHGRFREITEIVAATMEFNYFEVVSAARDLADELKVAAGANDRPTARGLDDDNKYVAGFRRAVARLQQWTDQRVQLLADKRRRLVADV